MERILALQKMVEVRTVEDNFLASTQSGHCSSNSNNRFGCSSQSIECGPAPTTGAEIW